MKVSEEQSGNHIEPEEEINKKSKRDIRPEAANQAELKIWFIKNIRLKIWIISFIKTNVFDHLKMVK